MKKILRKTYNLPASKAFAGKLGLLLLVALLCFGNIFLSYANPLKNMAGANTTPPPPPSFTYTTPSPYIVANPITPLSPVNSNVSNVLYSSPVIVPTTGITNPQAIVFSMGNMYVLDSVNQKVYSIATGTATPVVVASDFVKAAAMAVDYDGNIYIADASDNEIIKFPYGGGAEVKTKGYTGVISMVAYGTDVAVLRAIDGGYDIDFLSGISISPNLTSPNSITTDGQNLYVTDPGSNSVYKITYPTNTTPSAQTLVYTDANTPAGITVDAYLNIYISELKTNAMVIIPNIGTPAVIASGFSKPLSPVVTVNNSIYICDAGNAAIKEISRTGGYALTSGTVYGGYPKALPTGISFDISTGVFSGTPTAALPPTIYYVAGFNADTTVVAMLTFKVGTVPLPTISYTNPGAYTVNTAITPLAPASSGVAAFGYSSPLSNESIYQLYDAKGNAYYHPTNSNYIMEYPANGGPSITIPSNLANNAFLSIIGLAIDSAGNFYTCEVNTQYGTSYIVKIPAGGGNAINIAKCNEAISIVADAAGDIFYTDNQAPYTLKMIAAGTSTIQPIYSFLDKPAQGLVLDRSGYLYVAQDDDTNLAGVVTKINTIAPYASANVYTGYKPFGVSGDSAGNIYISNEQSPHTAVMIPSGGSGPAVTVSSLGGYVISDPEGNLATSTTGVSYRVGGYFLNGPLPAGLSFNVNTGVISGTPTASSPAANYSVTAYNSTGGTTTNFTLSVINPSPPTLSYSSPQIYHLSTAITPLVPASTNVASPGYNSSSTTVAIGTIVPQEVTIDNKGNLYITDPSHNALYKMPLAGGTPVNIAPTLVQQYAVAVDGAGNVYTTDNSTNIEKIPVNGGPPVVIAQVQGCNGLAVDIYGNLYAANSSSVIEFPVAGGAPIYRTTGVNNGISGMAVDNAGNLYTCYNNQVWKIPAGSNQQASIALLPEAGIQLTVDAAGNLFVTYGTNGGYDLGELQFSAGYKLTNLSAAFQGGAYGVTVDPAGNVYVANDVAIELDKFTPIGGFHIGPVLPGLSFDENTGAISGTPTIESPATNYTITAYNISGSGSANLNIKVTSTNDTLAALNVTPGILTPAFSSAVTSYTDSVAIDSVKITPVLTDTLSTVTVNGTTVKSGTGLGVPLVVGNNTIPVKITASDGVTTQTYTLTVNRTIPSSNAGLANIVLNNGALFPAFSTSVTSYTATTNYVSLTVTPTALNQYATIAINGQSVNSGSPSAPIHLAYGTNTLTTQVTAQDGTIKDYTITITRMHASSTRTLAGLFVNKGTLTPAFNADSGHYVVNVTDTTATITVRPQPGDATETIMVNDSLLASGKPAGTVSQRIPLVAGDNTIKVLVTSQNGLEKYYIITVIKPRSSDANLYSLVINKGTLSPSFNTDTTNYTDSVSNTTGGVAIHALPENKYATLKINGVITAPGVESPNIPLNVGNTTLQVVVTAQDNTVKKYTINVNRAASTNDDLDTIALGAHTAYTPVFNPDSTNYTAYVTNNVTQLTIATHTAVTTSIIKLDGENINSNHFYYFDNLAVGSNLTTCQVIAQDGITTKTYNLNIIRASADTGTTNLVDHFAADDGLVVHQAITPNGDGINDVLTIDKISAFPNNKLMVISITGALVYEVSGYDNKLKAFDGHSSMNGKLQPAGTYFYSLQYTVNGKSKTKTGYVVLKY